MKRAALSLVVALAACSDDRTNDVAPRDQRADLGGEVIARISAGGVTDTVAKGLVAKVAVEQKIPPSEAAKKLVDDAVAAVAGRDRGLAERWPTRWLLRSARARIVVDRLRAQARAAGPPTDDEIKELSQRHWREVDRPEAARVVHAVVLRSKPQDPARDARAKALAQEIRKAVADATSPEDFLAKAKAVPHDKDLAVSAEPIPAVTDDGFSIEGPGTFDVDFCKAALALQKPGETSPVIETAFGWHVLRLVEKVPEQRMPFDARRIAFTEEVYSTRARRAYDAVLGPLRASHRVTIEPTADESMRSVMTGDEK